MVTPTYYSKDIAEVVSVRGRDILALGHRKQLFYCESAFRYWRSVGFPHIRVARSEAISQLQSLKFSPLLPLRNGDTIGASTVGLRVANSYHPQMWRATSHGHLRSPYEYFHDDNHLRTMLGRAPRFWPAAKCWSPQAVRNLVRIYSGGRVANFRPFVARNIIHSFSRDGDIVLDFSAGYGGRLLACLTLRRFYIGIDPARRQVLGLMRMLNDLKENTQTEAKIIKGCAEEVLPDIERNSVDLVFSSPPFFNLEKYSKEKTQSSRRYETYEQWWESFLKIVVAEAWKVLRRKGLFAINVPSKGRFPLESDTLKMASKLFEPHCKIGIEMPARPLQRAKNSVACRAEPIYVFRKR